MIETLALALTGLGLTASIIYYSNILNNANKTRELQLKTQEQAAETRQTQLFMKIYERFESKEFVQLAYTLMKLEWSSPEDYYEKYGPDTNPEMSSSIHSVTAYFEGIGLLVHRGLIDISLIDDLMSDGVIVLWEKIGDVTKYRREQTKRPHIWEWTEYLYNEMIKRNPELSTNR